MIGPIRRQFTSAVFAFDRFRFDRFLAEGTLAVVSFRLSHF